MSYVIAVPETLTGAATALAGIGSAISSANAAATKALLAAAADEVSQQIAVLFGADAQSYQALSAELAAFHDQFVATLTAGAASYAATEAANASPIQDLLNIVNAPTEAERPERPVQAEAEGCC